MKVNASIMALMLCGLLVLSIPLGCFTGSGEAPSEEPPTRDLDYTSFNAYGLGTHYMGTEVTFRVQVVSIYSGEHWVGDENTYLHDDLYYAKLTILWDQTTDYEGNPVSGVIQPSELGSMNVYNDDDGRGYNISYSQYYYNTDMNDNFRMMISSMDIKEGDYKLPLKIDARVQTNFDAVDPSGYTWMTITHTGYVQFTVRSYLTGVGDGVEIRGYENGYCPIYAGAKYLSLMYNSIGPQVYGIEDVLVEIGLSTDYFSVTSGDVMIETLTYSQSLTWKVDVFQNAPAGRIYGSIRFNYNYNGNYFVDGPYNISIVVAATPLVMAPDTVGMTVPTVSIPQQTTEELFSIELTNSGNIDLLQVKVRLDLDSSRYLRQKQFYYDEDDYAEKVYAPLEFDANEIGRGESFTATFPAVSIAKMLPPGDYLVPVDYRAIFVDPSSTSGASIRLTSYQWDEIGQNDYLDMMYYREDPRPTDMISPHIMLRILDNDDIPEFNMELDTVLDTGIRRKPVTFRIINDEYYPISDATIEVWSSDPAKIWNSNSVSSPALLATQEGVTIPGSSFYSEGDYYLYSTVDVARDAGSGLFEVFVMVSGLNELMEPVEGNRSIFIMTKAQPGDLEVSSISTSEVRPGKDFDLHVRVTNTGDVEIENFDLLISCLDNMISVDDPRGFGTNLGPGETTSLSFECQASECMDYEKSSVLTVLTKVNDKEGNMKDYSDDNGIPINIRSAREPEELSTESAIKATGFYFLLALVISSFILGLAVVLSILLFAKAKYGEILHLEKGEKPPKKEKKPDEEEVKEPPKEQTKEELEDELMAGIERKEPAPPTPGPMAPPAAGMQAAPAVQQTPPLPAAQTPIQPQGDGIDDLFKAGDLKVDDLFSN